MIIECCISSIEGAKAAQKWNANRIELCSHLDLDGLTPNAELIKNCTKIFKGETHVMIRPHNNGFTYNSKEFTLMLNQIEIAKKTNANGVVLGVLNKNGEVDIELNKLLLNQAHEIGLTCTFHRAFDQCINPINALEKIIALGFDWLLTSGQQPTAFKGIDCIKKLVTINNGRIKILAGSGVNPSNAKALSNSGVDALHFTIDKSGSIEEDKIKGIFSSIQ